MTEYEIVYEIKEAIVKEVGCDYVEAQDIIENALVTGSGKEAIAIIFNEHGNN